MLSFQQKYKHERNYVLTLKLENVQMISLHIFLAEIILIKKYAKEHLKFELININDAE